MLGAGDVDFAWPAYDFEPTDEDADDYCADCEAQETEHEENSGNDGPPADGPLY